MPSLDSTPQQHGYWRSLAELADSAEYHESQRLEFLHGVPEQSEFSAVSRRRFTQIMGASVALASAVGCRWPQEKVLPLAKRPEGMIPGVPQYYSTAFEIGGVAQPLLATSRDGRPTKIDGNPDHPASQTFRADGQYKYAKSCGGSSVYAQASVLDLYDPDRSRKPARGLFTAAQGTVSQGMKDASWEDFSKEILALLDREKQQSGGAGICILSEASGSPTGAALRKRFKEVYPRATWYEYEPLSYDNEREGLRAVFGKPYRPLYLLDRASRLVCFDADLFGTHPNGVQYGRDFARGRNPEQGVLNRLYAVESTHSLTGATADHRLAVRSSDQYRLLVALAKETYNSLKASGAKLPGEDLETAFAFLESLKQPVQDLLAGDEVKKFVKAVADDLAQSAGKCVVAVGPNQPPEAHAVAHALNAALGNAERTVRYLPVDDADRPSHLRAIEELAKRIGSPDQNLKLLLILGGNPVYNAPANVKFAQQLKAFAGQGTAVHLSRYRDETSRLCNWHVPQSHYLEQWGDLRTLDGTVTLQQPLIEPLYGTKSTLELLALLLEEKSSAQEAVRKHVEALGAAQSAGEGFWERSLHNGFVADTALVGEVPKPVAAYRTAEPKPSRPDAWEIVFAADNSVLDGRFANNAWLQEAPDFLTKLTWDNAILVGPETAERNGLKQEQVVKLSLLERSLEAAIYILPGLAPNTLVLPLGYGRTAAGRVAGDTTQEVAGVGFDTYVLRSTAAFGFYTDPTGSRDPKNVVEGDILVAEVVGKTYRFASTQDHFAIDKVGMEAIHGRIGSLIREATQTEYAKNPEVFQITHGGGHGKHEQGHGKAGHDHGHDHDHDHDRDAPAPKKENKSLWKEWEYDGHKWGMSIDLSKCCGCNSCVVACQAENNIPVVGKEQVRNGREMHWLRIDRYFAGSDAARPDRVVHQPVPCMQCENAPCEQVCPVAATIHSHEGLNDMVYNRCIGTRYCSNNCPFKVRRFNFFDYHSGPYLPGLKAEPVINLDKPENGSLKMVYNPEVTIRIRGVMEKCTYCVQRIQNGKIVAKNERRPLEDMEIQPACAQACSAQAILFGDLNNADSKVAKAHREPRAYEMLGELNIKARTLFLGRILNPNPALEDKPAAKAHA